MSIIKINYQGHPYHLVDISPWPILTSFAMISIAISAVIWFHGYNHGKIILLIGFLSTLFVIILWFRDVTVEGTFIGYHTFRVQEGLNLGFVIFVISEIFFFISIFWAYFHSALAPTVELGSTWPPAGIEPLNPFAIPLLNTIVLLSSGAAVTYSHHSLIHGDRKGSILGLIITIILAIFFTGLQGLEYYEAPFNFSDSAYGTVFFFATGFHGLHVIIGTLFLAVGLGRLFSYHLTTHHHLGFESAILYWHFVDVVWLFLFVAIYYWGS